MKQTSIAAFALLTLVSSLVPTTLSAQSADELILTVRPHCEEPVPEDCEAYEVVNPEMIATETLNGGAELDFDIIIENPENIPISRVRSWIAYDPNFLTGLEIEPNTLFPLTTPGETDFNAENGYIQLEVAAEEGLEPSGETIIVARIRMKLTQSPISDTAISFYDVQEGGHTEVTTLEDVSVLETEPGTLLIQTAQGTSSASSVASSEASSSSDASSSSSVAVSSASSSSEASVMSSQSSSSVSSQEDTQSSSAQSSSEQRSAFVLLQVQQLRVTTDGSTVYLSWNPLQSSSLQGYNIYYGSLSGQYLQRRSIGPDEASITLRNLPTGMTYYFAVRAVNTNNEESAFSQEVAVTVGDPSSSTSPLVGSVGGNPIDRDAGVVPGETGASSFLALFLLLSAVIGTSFAWRRQAVVTSPR